MSEPLRFTTLRVGAASVTVAGHAFEFDLRVLQASDGSYRWLTDALSEPLPSVDAAVLAASAAMSRGEAQDVVVRWRAGALAPLSGEHPCPICGAPALDSPRYPDRLCPACVVEATDAAGRRLTFGNRGPSGGFEARYVDGGAPYADHACFVRGIRCWADEAYLGGIVVRPSPV